jgi:hypothetical protein
VIDLLSLQMFRAIHQTNDAASVGGEGFPIFQSIFNLLDLRSPPSLSAKGQCHLQWKSAIRHGIGINTQDFDIKFQPCRKCRTIR